jgi:hypothetical protein
MEFDEGAPPRVTGAQVMRLDGAVGIGGDEFADAAERLRRRGFVHQARDAFLQHPPAGP